MAWPGPIQSSYEICSIHTKSTFYNSRYIKRLYFSNYNNTSINITYSMLCKILKCTFSLYMTYIWKIESKIKFVTEPTIFVEDRI